MIVDSTTKVQQEQLPSCKRNELLMRLGLLQQVDGSGQKTSRKHQGEDGETHKHDQEEVKRFKEKAEVVTLQEGFAKNDQGAMRNGQLAIGEEEL